MTPVAALAAITRATGYPMRYHEFTEAEADALGEQIGNTWRLLRESAGWHADIPALREIHPALSTLESWLVTTGAAKIKARQDNDRRATTSVTQ